MFDYFRWRLACLIIPYWMLCIIRVAVDEMHQRKLKEINND